jgi:hypothetical protein
LSQGVAGAVVFAAEAFVLKAGMVGYVPEEL